MIAIAIETRNYFYELGIFILLKDILKNEWQDNYSFITIYKKADMKNANVIFKDDMIIVNIFHGESFTVEEIPTSSHPIMMTIISPFNSSELDLHDITYKIRKILNLAKLNHMDMMKIDIFKRVGLEKHRQLSIAESKIVQLSYLGNNTLDISKILECSEKTILTHRRNAIRKLGVSNRLEFYNYISHMRNYSNNETFFICI